MLGGIVLATVMLGEKLPPSRAVGAVVILSGLFVVGAESVLRTGMHGAGGDLVFVGAGLMFAMFGALLRRWQLGSVPAVAVICALSLLAVPVHWATGGIAHMISLGWRENLVQIAVQGVLMGIGATYLYVRSVVILGAGRAAVFPALVPPFVLLTAWLVLGQVPTALQLLGLTVILGGFWLAQTATRALLPSIAQPRPLVPAPSPDHEDRADRPRGMSG